MIISTGSQGEPYRRCHGLPTAQHPVIELKSGDTVVLASSRTSRATRARVYRVINGLTRTQGAHMSCTEGMRSFMLPGTPARGSCSTATTLSGRAMSCRSMAKCGIPKANGDLAIATGVPADRTIIR